MHSHDVAHKDFNLRNILLQCTGIYVTDFGISRDKSTAVGSTTDREPNFSRGYALPEVEGFSTNYNARQCDIYYLGCLLLHILTVVYAPDTAPSGDEGRHIKRRESFTDHLKTAPRLPHPYIPEKLVEFLAPMFAEDREQRPDIEAADRALDKLSGSDRTYYGPCCRKDLGMTWFLSLELYSLETRNPPTSIGISAQLLLLKSGKARMLLCDLSDVRHPNNLGLQLCCIQDLPVW